MIPETSARQAITLAGQGHNVSEIARHLGHDRKTIRIYLNGHRAPGQPRPHADSFVPFAAYIRQRAADDPHLRSTGLHREVTALGYPGSYSAFTRELRGHRITAACGTCRKWKPITPAQAREHHPGQPLPFRAAPLGGETIASYLSRTAAASHLPTDAITACLPPWFAFRAAACDDLAATGQPQPADIAHLAALTGTSETALRRALPALAGGGRPPVRATLACRRCAAQHGQRSPLPVHIPAHQRAFPATPDLARPRHPGRPRRRPGHHRRQPERVQARPRARHHQARARRGHRPRKGSRRASRPATRRRARPGQPGPGSRAPGHGRGSGLPRDDQDGRRDPQRITRRAGITGKPCPQHLAGRLTCHNSSHSFAT